MRSLLCGQRQPKGAAWQALFESPLVWNTASFPSPCQHSFLFRGTPQVPESEPSVLRDLEVGTNRDLEIIDLFKINPTPCLAPAMGLKREERADITNTFLFAVRVWGGWIERCQHDERRGSCSAGSVAWAELLRQKAPRMPSKVSTSGQREQV